MRVGFVGLGTMGSRNVMNLLKAGHDVVVNDVRRAAAETLLARGARWVDSPRQAAAGAEIIFTSLPGPSEVELVALGEDGIVNGAQPGSIYCDLSTSSPTLARRITAAFAARGRTALDTPVSGGPYGAETGTLIIMCGGDEEAYGTARPVLEALGDNINYIGEAGAGQIAKLVHNMIGLCAGQLLAEGMTLGVKAGVDPERLRQAIIGGAYGKHTGLHRGLPEVVFKGDFDNPRFALALARKDVGLATALGREFNVPMPLANLAEQTMVDGIQRGWGGKDSSATFMIQEERAGVKVRTD
jgi:3-hydroxyisobutyrate dehydrogenase